MYQEDTPHESVSESLHNYKAKSDVLITGRQSACDIINQAQLAVTTNHLQQLSWFPSQASHIFNQ
jgi:ATP:corrinoid adenosyltransferase